MPLSTPTNQERQGRGEACIRHWKECAGENPDMPLGEEDVVDVITDLFHFIAANKLKPTPILHMAKLNFEAEKRGER